MNYTLALNLHIQPNDNMPAKELMYYYSSYAKDLQEAKEKELAKRKKGSSKVVRIPMQRK